MRLTSGRFGRNVAGLIGGGAAVAGGLALANRLLQLDDLPPTLPGANLDWTWHGWRVRAVKLGEGPPIVLVHGIHAAASSFEMRGIFEPLSREHTVYALDLLGFGKSERPAAPYSGELYAELLMAFLGEIVRGPATVIGASLSAAYVVEAARQRPALFERLVLISPTGTASLSGVGHALGRVLAVPVVGSALFNLLVSRSSLDSYLHQAYVSPSAVDEALIDQNWATAHQPNARLAPAAFLAGRLDLPFRHASTPIAEPILVVRGAGPGIGEEATDEELRALGPRVRIETINGAGQLPHDEVPNRTLALIESWLASSG